jgi:arylsulfatase
MDAPSHVIDLLPTSLDLAQAPAATNIHGQSLSYLWTGKKANPRTLYWEHQGNEAIRTGNFKLVKEADEADWALYDLETDPSENKNIAQQSEKKVDEMSIDFDVWAKKVGVKQSKKKVKE